MKPKTTNVGTVPYAAMTLLLVAALAVAAFVAFSVWPNFTAPNGAGSPGRICSDAEPCNRSQLDVEIRNRRLLELNEGIKPVVTAVPFDRNKRLLELNEGIKPVVTAAPIDRNRRLLELNEGYLPTPMRTLRDQRLYEINR